MKLPTAKDDSDSKYTDFRPDYPRSGSLGYGTHPFHKEFIQTYREGMTRTRTGVAQWRRPRFFQTVAEIPSTQRSL